MVASFHSTSRPFIQTLPCFAERHWLLPRNDAARDRASVAAGSDAARCAELPAV